MNIKDVLMSEPGRTILYDEPAQQAALKALSRRPEYLSQEDRERRKVWKRVREFGRGERRVL